MIEEQLELRHAACARQRDRNEQPLRGERPERRDGSDVLTHRLAAREHRVADTRPDRVLDEARVSRGLVTQQRHVAVEVAHRRGGRAIGAGMRVALIEDRTEAIAAARAGEDARGDRRRVRLRHVHDRRGFGTRDAMRLDEGGAQRAEEPLARREPALAGVHRTQRLRAEQQRARDRAPTAEGVLHRRLTQNEVRVARVEQEPAARRGRAVLVLREPRDELAHGALVLEPDVHLARLRRVTATRAPFVDAEGRAVTGDGVQAATGDDRFEQAELEEALRRGVSDRRLDGAQRGHERGDVARRVQRGDRLAQRLRRGIGSESLDELPVRHAPRLEPARALLVVGVDRLDEEGAALTRAYAAAEGLLRRHGRIALPQEGLDDHRPVTGRAVRTVELAHRDAVRRADEHAVGDALERGEDIFE